MTRSVTSFQLDSPRQQLPVACIETARTSLHPVTQDDLSFLYELAIGARSGARWRYRGRVPAPEAFREAFWSGVLTQLLLRWKLTGEPMGLVVCYDHNAEDGYASLAAHVADKWVGRGEAYHGVLAFAHHIFNCWAVRKLYLEVPQPNLPAVERHLGTLLVEEGVLRQHDFSGGQYWDKHILALYREAALAAKFD